MNIKGVFQIWMRDGSYHEIPLKECHAWTREGCTHCPDFAAEHADISTGGIGKDNDWTLTIVRTDLGREIISRMIDDGSIIARPGDEDPGAIALHAQAGGQEPRALARVRGRRPPACPAVGTVGQAVATPSTGRPRAVDAVARAHAVMIGELGTRRTPRDRSASVGVVGDLLVRSPRTRRTGSVDDDLVPGALARRPRPT